MTPNAQPSLKFHLAEIFSAFGKTRHLAEATEADTRCELIDRILAAIGWPSAGFAREVSTQTGDFVDYQLPRTPQPTMVVEAKRVGASFALDPDSLEKGSRTRALSTLRSSGGMSFRDAIKQAAGYCNDRAIPYACITNGYQWVFFRGLSSETHKWPDGRAVVFPSAESVLAHLDMFRLCVAPEHINSSQLARLLSHPTQAELPGARRPIDYLAFQGFRSSTVQLSLRQEIGRELFANIHGGDRSTMLENCYVEPGVLPDFDSSLRRLLADTLGTLEGVDRTEEGGASKFVQRIQDLEYRTALRSPVLVVGNVGVGKTTFLHKALSELRARPRELDFSADPSTPNARNSEGQAIFAYVDLENRGALLRVDEQKLQDETAELIIERLAKSAEQVLKKRSDISESARAEANPDREVTLRTMLRKELEREKSVGHTYFQKNEDAWLKAEYDLFQKHRRDAVAFLIHYVRHLRARFKRGDGLKYPILLILDNLDQASPEYQRCIYGLGLRLAKETPAVVIISIREDTFHQAREKGGFLTSSALEFVFHVPAPALDQVLRRRLKYADWARQSRKLPRILRGAEDEVDAVVGLVRDGLLSSPMAGLEVISALSGHDTRGALYLVREFLVGAARIRRRADGTVDFALEALLATGDGTELPAELKNVFDAAPNLPPLHGLRARLLGYYCWALDQHPDRGLNESTELVLSRFSAWGYPPEVLEAALADLLKSGLLVDSSLEQASDGTLPARLSISAAGHAHIVRLISEPSYRAIEALFTRWYDRDLADEFIRRASEAGTKEGTTLSDIVAAGVVSLFDAYLGAAVARENAILSRALEHQPWILETMSRSEVVASSRAAVPVRTAQPEGAVSPKQMVLIEEQRDPLPRLPGSLTLAGTVWLPRILWALEFSRANRMGALTAAQISRVLCEHGDIDVPDTNVARAFREFRRREEVQVFFHRHGKRYTISPEGTRTISSLIRGAHL